MTHNVYYTEGEIMVGVYAFATAGTAALLLLGLANRSLAAWLIVICGGSLVLWQAYQQRRWAILHEEVVGVLAHIHQIQQKTGNYPTTLDGYTFSHPEFKSHISYSFPEGKMSLGYYLNNPGTGYWYHQDSGFGYYPD